MLITFKNKKTWIATIIREYVIIFFGKKYNYNINNG